MIDGVSACIKNLFRGRYMRYAQNAGEGVGRSPRWGGVTK